MSGKDAIWEINFKSYVESQKKFNICNKIKLIIYSIIYFFLISIYENMLICGELKNMVEYSLKIFIIKI